MMGRAVFARDFRSDNRPANKNPRKMPSSLFRLGKIVKMDALGKHPAVKNLPLPRKNLPVVSKL